MKICSLLPSGTEILYALGLQDSIIGVSDLCDYPPQVEKKIKVSRSKVDPSVLSSDEVEAAMLALLERGEDPYELDYEWLVREAPDVILTQDLCHVCEIDADGVNASVRGMAEQPEVVVLRPTTFGEILDSFVQVGEACGDRDAGTSLATSLRKRAELIGQTVAKSFAKPRVFSLEGINPLVIGGHWIPEMLRMAGGDQPMLEPGCPARRLNWREVVDYAPEKLFVDLCSSDIARNLREVPWLAHQARWESIPAVISGEVYVIDHAYFSRPGPRVIEGLEILAQLTHPDLFTGQIPPGTVAKLDARAAGRARPEEIAECFVPFP